MNFTLDGGKEKDRVEESDYYKDLEKSTQAIKFESSFPVGFAIGKSVSRFKSLPYGAYQGPPSRLTIRLGACRLFMKTGAIQVHRYLFTDRFIKLGEELTANRIVKLEAKMALNLRMSSQLILEVPKATKKICWKYLYGRRTYLGRYHMHHSQASLLASPGSPPKRFMQIPPTDLAGSQIFAHWNKDDDKPILRNEMDFPATVESNFFRSQLASWGFYYVKFQPVLRSVAHNSLIIRIPTTREVQTGSIPQPTKK